MQSQISDRDRGGMRGGGALGGEGVGGTRMRARMQAYHAKCMIALTTAASPVLPLETAEVITVSSSGAS